MSNNSTKDYDRVTEMLINKNYDEFERYIASWKSDEIDEEISRLRMNRWQEDVEKEDKTVEDSNFDNHKNQYLCYATPRQGPKLIEYNTDFISDENLQALKAMNFRTDKEKVGFVDLLNWLPKIIPGTCAPSPQKCSNYLYIFNDWEEDDVDLYAFIYGEITHRFSKSEATDFRITYELSKEQPAFIVSTNPLEGILNMVVWVLENCVNNYSYQTWLRGWYFKSTFDSYTYQSFKDILGKIEDDEYGVNHLFTDLGFIIKNPRKK